MCRNHAPTGQEDGYLRRDLRARHLTRIYLGPLGACFPSMALENQFFNEGDEQKRIAKRAAGSVLQRLPFEPGASRRC